MNRIPLALAINNRVARVLAYATPEGRVMVPIKAAKRQQVARAYADEQGRVMVPTIKVAPAPDYEAAVRRYVQRAEAEDRAAHPEFYRLLARKFFV